MKLQLITNQAASGGDTGMINSDKRKSIISILFFILVLIPVLKGNSDKNDIKNAYLEGRFGEVINKFNESSLDNKEVAIQLIYLESLIRSGELKKAEELFVKMKNNNGLLPELRIFRGMIALAKGNLIGAEEIAASIIEKGNENVTLIQLKFYIKLYKRNFTEAESILSSLHNHRSGFGQSYLYFLMSAEYYRIVQNFKKLSLLYKGRMKSLNKKKNRIYYENLNLNYKLYKKKTEKTFWINSERDKVEIPLVNSGKGQLKTILLKKGEKKYSILLDTGNTSGWLIHSRELREELKSSRGGRVVMQVGTESGNLDGFNIFSRALNFDGFSVKGMFGTYVPKPRSDFFDANLNPAMLRNRIVSLDFINNLMILRTRERFESDITEKKKTEVMKIPWYGYNYTMVPVICNSKNSFAVIETGAENISVRSDFASEIGVPMVPRSKYLSNGKVFKYSLGAVNVQLGKYIFVRKQAEIWPLKRFRNLMTGFAPHIIIGPEALWGKFIVSFVPEENILVFEYERKN